MASKSNAPLAKPDWTRQVRDPEKLQNNPSSSTISLDYNASTSVNSQESLGDTEGTSGAMLGNAEAAEKVAEGTSSDDRECPSSSSSLEVAYDEDVLSRAMATVGNWNPFLYNPECCRDARRNLKMAHIRAKFVQRKVARLQQESRKLTRALESFCKAAGDSD